ncbi:hypothetical protein EIN_084970 [Entamoeba invadens IP1]|uniref:hypothetical protein n=1 Tax=Entamoeba invadens IP1 TaxID=370355 RepID=UPI0002C3EFCD|nr:hypothetical protein EIN_084970 [Entamoeba invadens IP1]ELP85285.1 hypothetical protein EIN_084970 [Entamoeba invadens IP1]|eukprot:XP_004184631.1 hypothetical protein EIN_084970 [Entamoeba invadens IP1]
MTYLKYALEPLQPKEETLLAKISSLIEGTPEQAEQGLDIMSEALENQSFEIFLTKVNPTLYTNLLSKQNPDVIDAVLNFLILVSETEMLSKRVVETNHQIPDLLLPLLDQEDFLTATIHVIGGLVSAASGDRLGGQRSPRSPRTPSEGKADDALGNYVVLLPGLTKHLQMYDPLQIAVYPIICRLLVLPGASSLFFREGGSDKIKEMLNCGNDAVGMACHLIAHLLVNADEKQRDTFCLLMIKAEVLQGLLTGTTGETVAECLRCLSLMCRSKNAIPAIASSPTIIQLVDCMKYPPVEPHTLNSLEDALSVISCIIQIKSAVVRFREVGFTLALTELFANFNEMNDRMQVYLMNTLMEAITDDGLMSELSVYNVEEQLKKVHATGLLENTTNIAIQRTENYKAKKSLIGSVQATLQGNNEELKTMEKAMDITKKRLTSKEEEDNVEPQNERIENTEDIKRDINMRASHSIRTPRKINGERKKRNAMIMRGFSVESLAEHYGEPMTLPKQPSVPLITPRILQEVHNEENKRSKLQENTSIETHPQEPPKEVIKEMGTELPKTSTKIIEIHPPKEKDLKVEQIDEKEPPDAANITKSVDSSDRLSLGNMKMPSVGEVISAKGNQEQVAFVSQVNAQAKQRSVCLSDFYQSQKAFNIVFTKLVKEVIPQLFKISMESKLAFPCADELLQFHIGVENALKELIEKNKEFDADVSYLFSNILNDVDSMKIIERYWIDVELEKVRRLRENSDIAKKLKEYDKEGFCIEKVVLQPMERFRRFVPTVDSFAHNTPDCCVEHDNIVKVYEDLVYLIAYLDEKRQAHQGEEKMEHLRDTVTGFDFIGIVILDNELCVKIGKKAYTLKVVVVSGDENLTMVGITEKKKKSQVKWTFLINKSTPLTVKEKKVLMNTKDSKKVPVDVQITFRSTKEAEDWYKVCLTKMPQN